MLTEAQHERQALPPGRRTTGASLREPVCPSRVPAEQTEKAGY